MWADEAFLRKVYRMAVDAAVDRSMGCALDPNLGQLGLDAYIVRECLFKSKVKECTQFKYFLFLAASNFETCFGLAPIPALCRGPTRCAPCRSPWRSHVPIGAGIDVFRCCQRFASPSPRLGVRGVCVLEAHCLLQSAAVPDPPSPDPRSPSS